MALATLFCFEGYLEIVERRFSLGVDLLSKELRQTVWEMLLPIAESTGLELVDVEFVGRHRGAIVRITVDSDSGVSLEDCSRLSKAASERLDQEDTFDQAYTLEVSSPGVDRPFRNAANYRRNLEKRIDVVLTEPLGKSTFFRGVLREVREDGIVLLSEKGEELAIGFDRIKRANRTLVF